MYYCRYCGQEIELVDEFCSHCGRRIQNTNHGMDQEKNVYADSNLGHNHDVSLQNNSMYKFCCILAYLGTFFWLPLVFFPNEKNSKYYANQGLWILILACLSCWTLHILTFINGLISVPFVGIVSGGIYSLIFTFFLIFMGFLFITSIKAIRDIRRNQRPEPIMFFEERAIIK